MFEHYAQIIPPLLIALILGGFIGLERTYRGRPAGFRTHALVCLASSLLMVLMNFQWLMIPEEYIHTIRTDPVRMAQGIMTGIGFLGAGVIMQDKQRIQGLTTAASIWITASIGILVGAGFYFAAIVGCALTLGILSLFGWLERWLPNRHYASLSIRVPARDGVSEDAISALIKQHQVQTTQFSHQLNMETNSIQYKMVIRSMNGKKFSELSRAIMDLDSIQQFNLRSLSD